MAILPYNTIYDNTVRFSDEWLGKITFTSARERSIIKKFGKSEDNLSSLLQLLKQFNPSICNVSGNGWFYDVVYNGETEHLPIGCLSTGERLVAVCHMAETVQERIIVCYEVACLDPKWRLWLQKLASKSKWVDVVPPTKIFGLWFELKGAKQ